MGKAKTPVLSDKEVARLRKEAERLGLRVYAYLPGTARPVKGRGTLARAIRGRQAKAVHSSVELLREERSRS